MNFTIQTFVVVSRALKALQCDNSRAKIHCHSTINKKVFFSMLVDAR